jgi:multidrug transporter EmrE-like cation transporter
MWRQDSGWEMSCMQRGVKMGIWVIFFFYVLLSATGLLLIKSGTASAGIAVMNGVFSLQLSFKFILGIIIYIISFLISIYLLSRMNLSLFYPIGTGCLLIFTCLFGSIFLKEHITTPQIFGIVLILAGAITMNIN